MDGHRWSLVGPTSRPQSSRPNSKDIRGNINQCASRYRKIRIRLSYYSILIPIVFFIILLCWYCIRGAHAQYRNPREMKKRKTNRVSRRLTNIRIIFQNQNKTAEIIIIISLLFYASYDRKKNPDRFLSFRNLLDVPTYFTMFMRLYYYSLYSGPVL